MRRFFKISSSFLLSAIIMAMPSGMLRAQTNSAVELKTVVIDAGHGGKDPGARNGNIREKDITLSIALQLGKMIESNYPSVKVIYTRTADKFVELHERANIANKNNADLFISIHVNSAKNKRAKGNETFVMGTEKNDANMEVCRLENNVVVLEEDYSSKYAGFDPENPESYIIFSLLQNSHLEQSLEFATCVQENTDKGPVYNNRGVKQANFLVLWKCTMPAVLIEIGFISNPNDLKIITSKSNQKKIAANIYRAFVKYKKNYDTVIDIPEEKMAASAGVRNEKETETEESSAERQRFGIQIFTSSKLLKKGAPEFKGREKRYFKKGNLYKYYIGDYDNKEDAERDLKKVRKSFPDAFIIKIEKNNRDEKRD